MNSQELEFFHALVKTRQQFYDQIQEAEKVGTVAGYWNSVVDKYSDQAHFIYELLQNADDAQAKHAHFELYKDHLVFRHDGTRRFSISDPNTYKSDRKNNKVGDINGITSIGGSGKFLDGAKIGKFGLGFKAVFQYTLTPSIYDGNISFRIHNYIVPELIVDDYLGRKTNETVFVFPFDRPDVDKQDAFNDIREKLKNLIFPNLFLNNLEKITYECFGETGVFRKSIVSESVMGDTTIQHLKITKGSKNNTDTMWLFSRTDEDNYKYSVGFFIGENGRITAPDKQYAAFCFFPTLVTTNLNFVIHAPFLLTDNREGIMAGNEHNKRMIAELASLAADAIGCMCKIGVERRSIIIDDNILDIIPFQENVFSPENDRSKVSFLPFYTTIKRKFQNAPILPVRQGYTIMDTGYWADTEDIPKLLSDQQLSDLLGEDAYFVFVTKGRNSTLHNAAYGMGKYIDSIVNDDFTEDDFYRKITPDFIEQQKDSWLIKLYTYILEGRNSVQRIRKVRKLPIFLDEDNHAVSAYDDNDHECLFLPDEESTGYPTINERILKNPYAKKLLDELGIKKPEQEDRIFNKIIPQYIDGVRKNGSTRADFRVFLDFFIECEDEGKVEDFIDSIKDLCFIEAISSDGSSQYVASPDQLYMPTEDLKEYFKGSSETLFVDLKEYEGYIAEKKRKHIPDFLERVGVSKNVRRCVTEYKYTDYEVVKALYGENWPEFTGTKYKLRTWKDYRLEGGEYFVNRIINEQSAELSRILWDQLVALFGRTTPTWKKNVLGGSHYYYRFGDAFSLFEGLDSKLFQEKSWLVNRKGEFVPPKSILKEEMASIYDLNSNGVEPLIKYLEIIEEDETYLSDNQKEKIELANKMLAMGISIDDLEEFKEYKRQKEIIRDPMNLNQPSTTDNLDASVQPKDSFFDNLDKPGTENPSEEDAIPAVSIATKGVIKDIVRRTVKSRGKQNPVVSEDKVDTDSDELSPSSVDFSKKIEREKEKSAAAIERIAYLEELQREAEHETRENKYSYKWFTKLLELESLNSGEANDNSREVSISFAKVEREPNTKRTLVLKHPNRYIPHFMEDLADIPMVLHFGDQTKTVAIEVANIKSYTLRVKLKNSESIAGVDLDTVTSVTIDAKSPAFLIEELRNRFKEFDYDDSYNMQENLCKNIEFVFGPPGTGKTTHLAKNVLIPMMQERNNSKVLVLTPTNKSADVLVRRIMEVSGEDHSFENWLIRFGATGDEEIEQSMVFRDKTFDIRTLEKSITVTTIARFPYDYFMPQGDRLFLHALNWDYIVIDEASMIPIADIVFPLYKKTPKCFIIAGDPFQIEPIASVNLWKDENIYSLVKLNSFVNPTTIHSYKVELLTTQYRSVPEIGYVFSNFAYGGILKHHRTKESQRPLNVGNDLGIETLNVIKFPVSKYESIYRCKKLNRSSSYQVYSALFVYEYVCYLSNAIAENNPGQLFKIGIIAPYRAQADMIDKLLASEKLPEETDVQVGTIHGFQGDECDIIFSIFNTPPTISDSREMFLNKTNIINVSISRARDYLFIVMPDDDTENIGKLRLVKKVENLIHNTDEWQEFSSPDLEELMFNDSHYFENNAFSTSHQSVNVYGLPEKYYEVRTEENAVDVQIHKPFKEDMKEISSENTDLKREKNQSYELDESVIPEELRKNAIDLPVKGAINGWCYLVPYNGKLKHYAVIEKEAMFIPILRNGQVKMVTVSVVRNDRIIYITDENFRKYEKELSVPEGIELRLTF